MMGPKVQRYSNTDLDRQPREVARLRVLKGVDRGTVFIINDSSVVLGRGDEANVRVADLKTSRMHARLDYTREGWILTDLGSANGILHHGDSTRKVSLRSGDVFTLGETMLEFLSSSENTRMLTAPLRKLEEIEEMDRALAYQKEKVKSFAHAPQPTAKPKSADESRRRVLLIGAALAAFWFMSEPQEEPKTKTPSGAEKKAEEKRNPAMNDGIEVDKDSSKAAEQYYRQGFREYREKNYLRAKAQFELALQVNPNHELARRYLYVAEQDINNQIKKLIKSAQKSKATGRLKESKGYFEAAMRLMYNDQSNPDFIECEDQVKKIVEELERNHQ